MRLAIEDTDTGAYCVVRLDKRDIAMAKEPHAAVAWRAVIAYKNVVRMNTRKAALETEKDQ